MHSISPMRAAALVPLLALAATLSACGDGPTELPRSTTASQSTGDATTQDMALDTYCDPDPTIGCTVVGGSPTPSPTPDPTTCTSVTCTSTGGDGGYQGGGGSGGGGGCTSSCDTSGDFEEGNPDSDCGVLECPRSEPDAAQQQQYLQALEKINKTKCPTLYQAASELYSGFKIWTNTKYTYVNGVRRVDLATYSDQPRYVSFWTGAFSRSDFPITVAHEAAHDLNYSDDGDAAEIYAKSCML